MSDAELYAISSDVDVIDEDAQWGDDCEDGDCDDCLDNECWNNPDYED